MLLIQIWMNSNLLIQKSSGIKLFLGSSTGNLVVDNKNQIAEIFEHIKIPIALHCEVDEIIKENEIKAKENMVKISHF